MQSSFPKLQIYYWNKWNNHSDEQKSGMEKWYDESKALMQNKGN